MISKEGGVICATVGCERGLHGNGDFGFVSPRLTGNVLVRKWVGKVTFQEEMECAKIANGSSRMSHLMHLRERGTGDGTGKCPHFSWYSLRICGKESSLLPGEDVHSPSKDAVTIAAFWGFGIMMPTDRLDLCKLLTVMAIQKSTTFRMTFHLQGKKAK